VLFRQYFFPFEVTSILLIIAAVAVMVLAARPRPSAPATPADRERELLPERTSGPGGDTPEREPEHAR